MTEILMDIPEGMSEEDMEEAVALLQQKRELKQKMSAARAEKMKDPDYKALLKAKSARYMAKNAVLRKKAIEAGITVSDAEIDAYLSQPGE